MSRDPVRATPSLPPLRHSIAVVLALLPPAALAACAGGAGPAPSVPAPEAAAPAATGREAWKELMGAEVGPAYETLVEESELPTATVQAAVLAGAARRAAEALARGRELGVADTTWYARHAVASQRWLRDIAAAADSGDIARARELIAQDAAHCDACHEAAGP